MKPLVLSRIIGITITTITITIGGNYMIFRARQKLLTP